MATSAHTSISGLTGQDMAVTALSRADAAVATADGFEGELTTVSTSVGALSKQYANVTTLLADTALPATFTAGQVVTTKDEGFIYKVAATDATDQHITTAGGTKLCVNALDDGYYDITAFGAKADGTDDSAYFVNAISKVTMLYLPETDDWYNVNDVVLRNGIKIKGAVSRPEIAAATGTSIFKTTAETFYLRIENLTVTGTSYFYLQEDRENYTGYSDFLNLETYASLETVFHGNFIFTNWTDIRDGYSGSINANHSFIVSKPSDTHIAGGTLQNKTSNLNNVIRCFLFRWQQPALDIEYAFHWIIEGVDFEDGDNLAIRSRGCQNLVVKNCWAERSDTVRMFEATNSRGLNSLGTSMDCHNNTFNISGLTEAQFSIRNSSTLIFNHNTCFGGSVGVLFNSAVDYNGVISAEHNTLMGSLPTSYVNTVKTSLDQTALKPKINMLPFGMNGVPTSSMTTSGYTATNIASVIGNTGDALSLEYSGGANVSYYNIPAKLVPLLIGKKISFVTTTYGNGTLLGTVSWIRIYTLNSPVYGDTEAATATLPYADDTDLSVTHTPPYVVPNGTTELSVAIIGGGATGAGSSMIIEAMSLLIGDDMRSIDLIGFS